MEGRMALFCGGGCGCFCLIILFIGVGIFVSETERRKFYRSTTCTVLGGEVTVHTCSDEDCRTDSNGNRHCTQNTYTCYEAHIEVEYELGFTEETETGWIDDATRYRSRSSANDVLDDHKVGSTDVCWYDSRNTDEVQYTQPDPIAGLVLMGIGGGFIGLIIFVACAVFVFMMLRDSDFSFSIGSKTSNNFAPSGGGYGADDYNASIELDDPVTSVEPTINQEEIKELSDAAIQSVTQKNYSDAIINYEKLRVLEPENEQWVKKLATCNRLQERQDALD